jgi:hypothetical protein
MNMNAVKTNIASLMALLPEGFAMDKWGETFSAKPCQNTLVILGLSTAVFYQAEHGINPRVRTIFDAMEYCSSSLSVGYTNIFPQTPIGKMIATLLMTFGPAMSGAILDGPKTTAPDPAQEKMAETLEKILATLQKQERVSAN